MMTRKSSAADIGMLMAWLLLAAGCADEYIAYHKLTGDPLILTRRAYSREDCIQEIQQDADELGVTVRHVHIKGSLFGQMLLWPVEPGYYCEAPIGPPDIRRGIYPREESRVLSRME
ncbi:hypothetical protein ACO9S2_08900 [Nitrospira sp. NS4]|uniref:hypothetical protein n=1 Tax=Nitrospira sp. NS4 TaxID=3414498 RepID=UPI003C2F91A2